jgi:hypothetical protein
MAVDLGTNAASKNAVTRARAAAEADGSLHPPPGETFPTTPAFRAAIEKLLSDGTYADVIATFAAADPDLA